MLFRVVNQLEIVLHFLVRPFLLESALIPQQAIERLDIAYSARDFRNNKLPIFLEDSISFFQELYIVGAHQ